jgi:sister-chromatid-cohesion protein PDS5
VVLHVEQVDVHFMVVQCLGWLFALPSCHVAQEYRLLFSDFLKRFGDKVVEVCIVVVKRAMMGSEANPFGMRC